MKNDKKNLKKKEHSWFRESFSDDYLWLYAHRNDTEAFRQVKAAVKLLPFEKGQKILDVACGAGRHVLAFARLGARMTGIDLSPVLIRAARKKLKEKGIQAKLINQDMRELNFQDEFDGITMWFSSFGYFPTMVDDRIVLRGVHRALKSGGWWWIDLPNPSWLGKNLIDESRRIKNGPYGKAHIYESRKISRGRVIKNIIVEDQRGINEYVESVRLYRPEQFGSLIKSAKLKAIGVLGDYSGGALTAEKPRQIWYGLKE
ncbi:MAG: methyltransferase domain-containing protein [candidate division Zixibacteria bacterium]